MGCSLTRIDSFQEEEQIHGEGEEASAEAAGGQLHKRKSICSVYGNNLETKVLM